MVFRRNNMSSEYKLSPSAAPRFLICTASLPHNTQFTESEITLKGNLQHLVAFLRLDQIINGKDHTAELEKLTDKNGWYYSERTKDLKVQWDSTCDKTVDNYVAYIKQLIAEFKPTSVLLEYRLKIQFYDNVLNGVIDCAMILPDGNIIIIDLKTGRVRVAADDNKQMLIYGHGLIQQLHKKGMELPKEIIISICQSLVNNTQAIRYTLKQFVDWYVDQAQSMQEINTHNLVYRPDAKACKYCQYRANCNERIKKGVI